MKNVIITGATGMVGGIVLLECLNSDEIGRVTVISRKPTGITNPKLEEIIHNDFLDYAGLENYFKEQDIAYFCIGVYTGQVPDKQFKTITVDFKIAFADMLKKHSPKASVCLLSDEGADQKEKSRMSFAKYKGMTENNLIKNEFGQLYIFRPGYIYPVEKRDEPNFYYKIMRISYPMIRMLGQKFSINSTELRKTIFSARISGAQKTIL